MRDRHFSETKNSELISFCRGTGCRRNVLERLESGDYWSRNRMENTVKDLERRIQSGNKLAPSQTSQLNCMKDALKTFPMETDFVHHRKDKNGRNRFAPIIGPDKQTIIDRFKNTGEQGKVWLRVSGNADIHSYRADYATAIYKAHARKIEDIPRDRINRGTGRAYQSDVYVCRKDESRKKLDKAAMLMCSKALGHNRLSVVADNYLKNL